MENTGEQPQLSPLYSVVLTLDEKIRGVAYSYTTNEDFLKAGSMEEMQLIYWSEIVQRIHVCGATSIKRVKKWYDAMQVAYQAKNYFAFCSAIRGLVEACCDTFYTVHRIINPICSAFAAIEVALNGKAKKALLCESLENDLIHYIFARKLTKAEKGKVPPSHDAKQVAAYLESVQDQGIRDLYDEMCQVSHPSTVSLVPFLLSTQEHSLLLHTSDVDDELNKQILLRHKGSILAASNYAILPAMCLLKYTNEFNAPLLEALRTDEEALAPAIDAPLWQSMKKQIDESRKANNGVYGRPPTSPP
jgi:hypothetical protein